MVFETKYQYSWGDGFKPSIDANVVGSVVEQLERENGKVTKEMLLDASRSKDSPTHGLFEWNNDVAAEKWRLSVATRTINNLRIVYVKPEKVEQKITAFINTSKPKEKPMYVNIVSALSNEGTREIVLERLRTELQAFIERNKHIEELANILQEETDKLISQKGV